MAGPLGDGIPRNARIDPVPQNSRNNPPRSSKTHVSVLPFLKTHVSILLPFHETCVSILLFPKTCVSIPSRLLSRVAALPPKFSYQYWRDLTQDVAIDEADVDVDGSQDGLAEPGEPDIEPQMTDIHINYLFHIVQALNQPPTNPSSSQTKGGDLQCNR
ncbi:hypothetical protein Pst134EA_032285 [Puccinia striiformis f. sp. tritici]|uniref:uncharacterized protein n=1 Tax=Puccinia striiformis f. sp. tritici TaxID=168172 RepID=UPI0020083BD9|nr:uncharacterized protein Pst134EA_032285 [Puccinia striiformis f. sp. tritici]KAH9441795.1 hypothetical protein Pst134EA_032285 [Puccinia striiformis f. sp. tritici]